MNSADSTAASCHSAEVLSDRLLVERCVSGTPEAWDEMYHAHHDNLIERLRRTFHAINPEVVEEISARVWYRLIRNDGELLNRFDLNQNCRLGTFLSIIAKSEAYNYFRSERRRIKREREACREESTAGVLGDDCSEALEEFIPLLTEREKAFFVDYLGTSDEIPSLNISQPNGWQLKSRILRKFRNFFLQSN